MMRAPFKRLGAYEILAPISEGGMASIWLGRSVEPPNLVVALKVIRPEHVRNKDFIAMFRDEARIASRLSHPNIVDLVELGHDGRQHFLAMEVLRGRTLLQVWEAAHGRRVRLPYEAVAWIGARVADALHHAHELVDEQGVSQGVVHRDVNPANIFLTRDGVPKLIDFGLAKARDRITSTAAGVVKGKLAYLAPEQAKGRPADRRADVFALGVTLWEVTLDRRLFRDDSDGETVRRVLEANVPAPSSLVDDYPPALSHALLRALAREPADRWQTAAELRDALDAFVRSTQRRMDEGTICAIVAELSADDRLAEWEQAVDEAAVGPERLRVWDDDRQKLTWMQAAITTAVPGVGAPATASVAESPAAKRSEQLDRALEARLARLDPVAESLAAARAHLERAVVDEMLGDGSQAAHHAEASLGFAVTGSAHEIMRRLGHARGNAGSLVGHVEAEIAECTREDVRAALLAERARLLAASGQPPDVLRDAWERVLAASPTHPAGLTGLEAALATDSAALTDHLARMATAYAAEPRLAAWLHVERARRLDRDIGRVDAAKAALTEAIALDGGLGPVRAECVKHAIARDDAAWHVALLVEEAGLEGDPARAACLEIDAAGLARDRLDDSERATALLEKAIARSAATAFNERRALDGLVALHESAGYLRDALRIRRLRLARLTDSRARANELRRVAALEDSLGDRRAAIEALEEGLEHCPQDATLAEELDRLLETESLVARRADHWARQAAVAADATERARRLMMAARLAESASDPARAITLLRAALVAHPADDEAVDRLLGLLAPAASDSVKEHASALIGVHAHAAEHAVDAARRIAHLEAMARLEEESLGDPARAAMTYEAALLLEPGRRVAILGLARTATRAGDAAKLARALTDEAEAMADLGAAEALRIRAADALVPGDPERALAILRDLLRRAPMHAEAHRLEQRIHESAGRWAQVDAVLAARVEQATDAQARVDLWMARAQIQSRRLGEAQKALVSLRAALAIDPRHPGVRDALLTELEALGDAASLRDALVEMASGEPSIEERVYRLVRAAEIDELVLRNDEHAAELYARALAIAPGDPWIEDRRAGVLLRRSRQASTPLPVDADVGRVDSLLDTAIARDPRAPHVLRLLQETAHKMGDDSRLASAFARQAESFETDIPKLGAWWALLYLAEWVLPEMAPTAVVESILRLAPTDRAALDAALRAALPRLRVGDSDARATVMATLGARLGRASSHTESLVLLLSLALSEDPGEDVVPGATARSALEHYRAALRIEPRSVVAAAGAARLGAALGDVDASIAAALAHADLAQGSSERASFLVRAASHLLSEQAQQLGARGERLARAGDILERALEAHPEALPAVALLVTVRGEDGMRDRLLATLRSALGRTRSSEAITLLGAEVARIAGADPPDRILAIDALRRVLAVNPGHRTTLRALADQYLAQEAWGEAVEALEALSSLAGDPHSRLHALFQLADSYGGVLKRSSDVERVLTTALDVDPANREALRRLLTHRKANGSASDGVAPLLARLADVEVEPEAKAAALTDLAELQLTAGDQASAEGALAEATAYAATAARVARLLGLHAGVPADQARVLADVVSRAQDLDRPDATCLAELGRLEIALGRWSESVAHLRLAVALAPTLNEARAGLAKGLTNGGAPGEAASVLTPMMTPDPAPLLSLRDPADALTTLERALEAEGRRDESLVARELRAVAGGLDDGAHAALRARRLVVDPASPIPIALDSATLRGAVPRDAPSLLFDLALALTGTEAKLIGVDPQEFGVTPRDRLMPAGGHPLLALVHRMATMLGIVRPEVALCAGAGLPRIVAKDAPWLVVPEALLEQPEPTQTATLARPLVRMALAVPWLEHLSHREIHALLCGAARQAVPGFASRSMDPEQQELADDFARRVGRAIGRRQKKALAELAARLEESLPPTLADAVGFERAVARTELRSAFVMTGDLLATLDAVRASDPELSRATASVGPSALAAALIHPVAGDVAVFALSSAAMGLRWRAGTLWSASSGGFPRA
jgi:tetratricopeptide (TPR) repeat protein